MCVGQKAKSEIYMQISATESVSVHESERKRKRERGREVSGRKCKNVNKSVLSESTSATSELRHIPNFWS